MPNATFEVFNVGDRVHHHLYGRGCVAKWNGVYSSVLFENGDGKEVKSPADLKGTVIRFDEFPGNLLERPGYFTVLDVKVFPRKGEFELKLEESETQKVLKVRTARTSFEVGRTILNTALSREVPSEIIPSWATSSPAQCLYRTAG